MAFTRARWRAEATPRHGRTQWARAGQAGGGAAAAMLPCCPARLLPVSPLQRESGRDLTRHATCGRRPRFCRGTQALRCCSSPLWHGREVDRCAVAPPTRRPTCARPLAVAARGSAQNGVRAGLLACPNVARPHWPKHARSHQSRPSAGSATRCTLGAEMALGSRGKGRQPGRCSRIC